MQARRSANRALIMVMVMPGGVTAELYAGALHARHPVAPLVLATVSLLGCAGVAMRRFSPVR